MGYRILLHPKANAFLKSAEGDIRDRIIEKLHILDSNPEKGEKLKYSDFWRLRIGDYRAIYEIDYSNKQVIVLFIGHRKDVYDDFSKLF